MVFTHCITDDTRAFSVRLIRRIVQFYHRVKYTTLYGLKSVAYIRKSTGSNYTHRIVDVILLHCFLHVYFMNLVIFYFVHFIRPFFYCGSSAILTTRILFINATEPFLGNSGIALTFGSVLSVLTKFIFTLRTCFIYE